MPLSTIKGTNCWTRAEDDVACLVSSCSATWRFLGAQDEHEALQRFWHDTPDLPEDGLNYGKGQSGLSSEWKLLIPHVVITMPMGAESEGSMVLRHVATGPCYAAAGVVDALFRWIPPVRVAENDRDRLFKNAFGDIIEDIRKKRQHRMIPASIGVDSVGRGKFEDYQSLGSLHQGIIRFVWDEAGEGEQGV